MEEAENLDNYQVEYLEEDEDGNDSQNCEYLEDEFANVECQICYQSLENSTDLKEHIEAEHCAEACPKCNKKFFTAALLRKHLRSAHLESMNMKCPLCELVLRTKYNLQQHLYTHSKDPCFECSFDDCDKTFRHINSLKQHERIHENRNRRKCPVCGQLATRLSDHIKTHNTQRPFACDLCDRRFLTMRQLAEHNDAHAGVMFKCKDCDMRYLNKNTLYKHRKSAHLMITYSCPFCSRVYNRKDNMALHMRRKHGKEPSDSKRMKTNCGRKAIEQ